MQGFVRTWSGMTNQWECDELGHLNMRYYLIKASEARQMFMMGLGLKHAFKVGAPSTVRLKDVHIKYLREARPGAPLYIETGLVALDDHELTLLHIMYHANGEVAATLTERLVHIYRRSGNAFNWPSRLRDKASGNLVKAPDFSKPKGMDANAQMTGPDLEQLKRWGCTEVGRGVFLQNETNTFGNIAATTYLGRLSDTIAHFTAAWPEFGPNDWSESDIMGVLLEIRLHVHTTAEAGDPFVFYSGVSKVNGKIRQLIHNFVNPFTGKAYASIIAGNALMHLTERRLVAPDPDNIDRIKAIIIPGLHG